ncbi:MAG: DUF2652 domain-containing protein [Bacteroidota bacterium]
MTQLIQSPKPTFLFIPDISGFTTFVNSTEISHSQHIIAELLEILIDKNILGLEVSEVEGDAVLFYREGDAPSSAEMLQQVKDMYTAFHLHLKKYENRRICQCGACSTTNNLTLKFVAHFGETAKNQIKAFTKLFGKDVIVAHRLLKNDVAKQEYLLVTDALEVDQQTAEEVADASFDMAEAAYDFGPIRYASLDLQNIRHAMPEPVPDDFGLPGVTTRVMTSEAIINAPLAMVFDVVSDLSFRHHWQEGLSGSDDLNHAVAQQGSTHRCVIKGDATDPFFVSHGFEKKGDTITFSDTNHKDGIGNVFSLQQLDENKTRIRSDLFFKRNPVKQLFFNLVYKKRLLAGSDLSWKNLDAYCGELLAAGEEHSSRIILKSSAPADEVVFGKPAPDSGAASRSHSYTRADLENKRQHSFCGCPVGSVFGKTLQ